MPEKRVEIVNPLGLHARPASELVRVASRFEADVTVSKGGLDVNGKSIMGVLMLAAECGSEITIRTDGEDAGEALDALADLVSSGFAESTEAT